MFGRALNAGLLVLVSTVASATSSAIARAAEGGWRDRRSNSSDTRQFWAWGMRDYECFSEESRIANLVLDPEAFPTAVRLQREQRLAGL
jgi:hypothetical protein